MPKRTIYFDESGYTGYNLLDPNQPIFSVASISINEERAADILHSSFPKHQADEFHFTNIWKTPRNRKGLLEFCGHLDEFADLSFCYATNKRFAVFSKMVDFLVEPVMTEQGYDFYGDGFCWKYSNHSYFGVSQFEVPEFMDTLLHTYQAFSRTPTQENLKTLQYKLRMMSNSCHENTRLLLNQMAIGAERFEEFTGIDDFRKSNNLHTSTMLAVVGHWRQNFAEDFEVIHDASSTFLRDREMWEVITGHDAEPTQIQTGDGSFVEYPLRVTSTEAVNSKDSWPVQFSDILAGLVAKCFDPHLNKDDTDFISALLDAGLNNISSNRNVPNGVFPDQMPPKRLRGPDVVDQLIDLFGAKIS